MPRPHLLRLGLQEAGEEWGHPEEEDRAVTTMMLKLEERWALEGRGKEGGRAQGVKLNTVKEGVLRKRR